MVSEVIMTSTNAFLLDENENILNLTYNLKSLLSNFYGSSHFVVHIYSFIWNLLSFDQRRSCNWKYKWKLACKDFKTSVYVMKLCRLILWRTFPAFNQSQNSSAISRNRFSVKKFVQVIVCPIAYFSDIFISGKNVAISQQKLQHFCKKWKYRKNMHADHN